MNNDEVGLLLPVRSVPLIFTDLNSPLWIGSTWANVGGAAVNTPALGPELVSNGNMETGDPPTGWSGSGGTRTRETTIVHGGSAAIKNESTSTNSLTNQFVTTEVDQWYRMNGWLYGNTSYNSYLEVIRNSSPYTVQSVAPALKAETWTNKICAGIAITTDTSVIGITAAVGSIFYMDDISYRKLIFPALFRLIKTSTPYGTVKAAWTIVAGTPAGVAMNVDNPYNPQNCVYANHNGTNVVLRKRVNGVDTVLISAAATYGAGKVIMIKRIVGTDDYQLWYGTAGSEVQIGVDQTITGINGLYHGLFSTDAQNSCSSFTFNGAGESLPLNFADDFAGGSKLWLTAPTWSTSGSVASNTPTTGVELLSDPGLEANYTDGKCDSIATKVGSPNLAESADVHGGSKAQQFQATAANDGLRYTVTPNRYSWYSGSGWFKRLSGSTGQVGLCLGETTVYMDFITLNFATYTQRKLCDICNNAATLMWMGLYDGSSGPYDVVVEDDLSLKEILFPTLFRMFLASTQYGTIKAAWSVPYGYTPAGVVMNADSPTNPQNCIYAYTDGITAKLRKRVAGVDTQLISASVTYGSGKNVMIKHLTANTYQLFYGTAGSEAQVGTDQTVSGLTGLYHGLFSTNAQNTCSSMYFIGL